MHFRFFIYFLSKGVRTFFSSMSFHTRGGRHVVSILATLSWAGGLSLVTQDVSYYVAESVLLALRGRVSGGRTQTFSMWIIFFDQDT